MTDVLLTFDVEDVCRPEAEGGDDRPKWLAEMLTAHGIRAQFLLLGDKYRRLTRNGRGDVARALEPHGVGIHTDSQYHPVIPELLENVGWDEGVERLLRYERRAAEACREFTGREPSATSQHAGLTGGAFSFEVARRMNLPYLYGVVPPLAETGGGVAFCNEALVTVPGARAYDTVHDCKYRDEANFVPELAKTRDHIDRAAAEGRPFLNVFLGHPATMRSHNGHMCVYLHGNGRDRDYRRHITGEDAPVIFPPEHEDLLKERFRRTCEMLASRKGVEYVTGDQLAGRYGRRGELVWHYDLHAFARRALDAADVPVMVGEFSPAEMTANLARFLLAWKRDGVLPERMEPVRGVLGPLEEPVMRPDPRFLDAELFWRLVAGLDGRVAADGRLPGNLDAGGEDRIGIGSFLEAMAKAYVAIRDAGGIRRVGMSLSFPRYPRKAAGEIDAFCASWHQDALLKPDLNVESVARYSRLALWTVRPALRR